MTITDRLIKAIDKAQNEDDIQLHSLELEWDGLIYFIDYTIRREFIDSYGASDEYGNKELGKKLVGQEILINTLACFNENGDQVECNVDLVKIMNQFNF